MGIYFCREVFGFCCKAFGFAVRFLVLSWGILFLPWGFWFCRDSCGPPCETENILRNYKDQSSAHHRGESSTTELQMQIWRTYLRSSCAEKRLLRPQEFCLTPPLSNWLSRSNRPTSLYVLFFHYRPSDGTQEKCFFQLSSYARAPTCVCM